MFIHTEEGPLITLGCAGTFVGLTAIELVELIDPQLLEREQVIVPAELPTVTTHV